MDYLLTLLSSGFFIALISTLLNSWQKDRDFKGEYYKKLIEKRFKAYETLEITMWHLNLFEYDNQFKGIVFFVFQDKNRFENFSISLFETQLESRWLNKETQNLIQKLSIIIAKIDNNNSLKSSSPFLEDILTLKRKLDDSSLIDFENLHNIEVFFKSKKSFWQSIVRWKYLKYKLS